MAIRVRAGWLLALGLGWGAVAAARIARGRRVPATVLYDGACPICRSTVERLRRWDKRHALRYLDARDAEAVAERFPQLPPDPELREMRLVFMDGEALGGFDAVRALSALLPPLRPLSPVLFLPGMRPMGKTLYRLIAVNRPQTLFCTEHSCPRPS
jgi:predicted DCC family thiol-disulfide oxidoreductase YuxK